MFDRVLIANRGAIAVRIARTLRAMGIESVGVYAEADRGSVHHRACDVASSLGEGNTAETYLNAARIFEIANATGAQAIHPGYGFLSESAEFVRACASHGIVFLGPTAAHMESFGLKHRAREQAEASGVPLLPGSGLLPDIESACEAAANIGYPVMLKSTAGGGGIGMQRCATQAALIEAFESVSRLAARNFSDGGIYLEKMIERARHVEVQVFGDGEGNVITLGERDCSAQRRNQKVIEETPAPGLTPAVRESMAAAAVRLCKAVKYESAGTVEFIYDETEASFYFLEVNTRLQVEHGVTEAVYDIDLVEWMVRLGAKTLAPLNALAKTLKPSGHAIQARIYAEDPALDFRPSAGRLSDVQFPESTLRVERAVESESDVSPYFDPMLAKLIAHGPTREKALAQLTEGLAATRLYGLETNLDYLRQLVAEPVVTEAKITTASLGNFAYRGTSIQVLSPGAMTTVQDAFGRVGYWHVGVPPSGAFDFRSFQLGNRLLGNDANAAGLEMTVSGPRLRFTVDTTVVLTGAQMRATLDGTNVSGWRTIDVTAGSVLTLGAVEGPGARAYLLVAGGIACPDYLGSKSTFTLGHFGGHVGRELVAGDVLRLAAPSLTPHQELHEGLRPTWSKTWQLRVVYGPHGAPDYLTADDVEAFFDTGWTVHHDSNRTGIRLLGPKPQWAREDGGEAGLHPSNIHDNAYAFGAVDFTGDMPVVLGPDGPSLGGFVCPATVIDADRWKLGQLRAGDTVRFEAVSLPGAVAVSKSEQTMLRTLSPYTLTIRPAPPVSAIIDRNQGGEGPTVTYRPAGDRFLLVEYGPNRLDIALRLRVDKLMRWLDEHPLAGLEELTPGIRSLQLHFDPHVLPHDTLLAHLKEGERAIGDMANAVVPGRIVHLPLAWNDAVCDRATEHYDRTVRPNAPWAPSNIEFIRRINGLDSVEDVKRIVYDASYLVMGLGDVYLGAPVATPLDPRHRLVTTKYNPARTWTAENSVGIGGAYLCVYGMEGPGGYQLVGRTVQMWNGMRTTQDFEKPWLLRFFDQIRFYEVSSDELAAMREAFPRGDMHVEIEAVQFSFAEYQRFLDANAPSIHDFESRRGAAFDAELRRWKETGQLSYEAPLALESASADTVCVPPGCEAVDSPVAGTLWKWLTPPNTRVEEGATIAIVEAMKTEIALAAPCAGVVCSTHVEPGEAISAGQTLAIVQTG